jgi:hypothetical protein
MATKIVSAGRPMPMEFATVSGLFCLAETATANDVHDQLTARLAQLLAMLQMTTGEAHATFTGHCEHVREAYMRGCAAAAEECVELARVMGDLREMERERAAA